MRNKESNTRKELLKSIPNYIGNVGKSVVFSGMDSIKEIAPEMSDTVISASEVTKNMVNDTRKYSLSVTNYFKTFKESKVAKDLGTFKTNALEDLKSGNFNNRTRMNDTMDANIEAEDRDMMAEFGINLDDGEDYGSLDDEAIINKMAKSLKGSGEQNNNITINNITSSSQATNSALAGIAQVSRVGAMATVQASNMQIANSRAIYANSAVTSYHMHTEITSKLNEATGYMKGVLDYLNTNVSQHYETTRTYYDKTMTAFDTLVAGQKEINEAYRKINGIVLEEDNKEEKIKSSDVFSGGFNVGTYKNLVKQRVKESKDNSFLLGMMNHAENLAGTTGMSALEMIAQNPLQFISKGVADKLFVNNIKDSLTKTNDSFKLFTKSAAIKFSDFIKSKDNPIFDMLGNIFGLSPDGKDSVKTDIKSKNIQFNTIVQSAIVDVIPTYLRKIYATMSGTKEMVFNYNTGKFNSIEKVQKEYDDRVNETYNQATGLRSKLEDTLTSQGVNKVGSKAVLGDFDTLKRFIIDEEHFFNPNKDKYDDLKRKGLTLSNGQQSFDLLRNLIVSTGRTGPMELNKAIFDHNEDYNRYMKEVSEGINTNGMSALFNDFKPSTVKPTSTGVTEKMDKYGKSMMDYVRDIKGILLEGVYVINAGTVTRRRNRNNSDTLYTRRLEDYTAEIRQFENRNPNSSNSGSDVYGNDNISPQQRRQMERDAQDSRDQLTRLLSLGPDGLASRLNPQNNQNNNQDETRPNGRLRGILSNISSSSLNPSNMANTALEFLDRGMYTLLYGNGVQGGVGSFIESAKENAINFFNSMQDKLMNRVIDPLEEKLFGENGILTKMHSWLDPKFNAFKNFMSDKLFGSKNNDGVRNGGILSNMMNRSSDLYSGAMSYITGKGYRSKVTGEFIPDKETSMLGDMKIKFDRVRDSFATSLFGDKMVDENGDFIGRDRTGWMSKFKDSMTTSFDSFKNKYFGNVESNFNIEESLPKMLSGAGIGAATSLFSTLFLPMGIGILPSMLLGSAGAFALSNDKFKEKLFGSDDKEGIISNKVQEAFKKYFPASAKGLALGGVLGTLTGHPILGPLVGSSIGFASKSEKFKEFLFGKDGDDSNALISNKLQDDFKKALPKGLAIGTGIFAASNLGLFGSFLLPSGPLGSAVLGLATSMVLQNENVKKYLFGNEDPNTGLKTGGLFGKVRNFVEFEMLEPARIWLKKSTFGMKTWFQEKILNPLTNSFKPITNELKRVGKNIFDTFKTSISNVFEKSVGAPFKTFLNEKVFNRLEKLFGGIFGKAFKMVKGVVEAPFSFLDKKSEKLAKKHEKLGMDYVSDWRKNKQLKQTRIDSDRRQFNKDMSIREQKFGKLQSIMREGGYDDTNLSVRAAKFDYGTKYRNNEYKVDHKFLSDKFLNVTTEIDEGNKISTKIFDAVNGIFKSLKEKTGDVVDKGKDKFNSLKDGAKNGLSSVLTLPDGRTIVVPTFNNTKDRMKSIAEKTRDKLNNMNMNSNRQGNQRQQRARGHRTRTVSATVGDSSEDGDADGSIDYKYYRVDSADYRTKNQKLKDAKVKGVVRASDITDISRYTKAIAKEVSGQLDGVGNNIHAIKKILSQYTGIDMKGDPIRGNKERRGFFQKAYDKIMSPFNYIGDKIKGAVDNVFATVGNVLDTAKSAVASVATMAHNILATVLNMANTVVTTAGKVLVEGTKAIGSVITSTVSAIGTFASETIKGLGKLAGGIAKGLGTAIGNITVGLGKASGAIVSGIGKAVGGTIGALGHLTQGVGAVTGSLLKASGAILEGAVNLTKGIVKTIGSVGKGIIKGVTSPFRKNKGGKGSDGSIRDVNVINFVDLINESSKKALNVNITGIADTIIDKLKCSPDDKKANGPVPALASPQNNIGALPMNLQLMANNNNQDKNKMSMSDKYANMLSKLNPHNIKSSVVKHFKSAKDDVNHYANREDVNYQNEFKSLEDRAEEKAVLTQTMAQSAEASKGTFGILTKLTSKKGLLSKLGTLFMMALPLLVKGFAKFKAMGGIMGVAKKLGGLLFSGLGKFFMKGPMGMLLKPLTSLVKPLGKLLAKLPLLNKLSGLGGKGRRNKKGSNVDTGDILDIMDDNVSGRKKKSNKNEPRKYRMGKVGGTEHTTTNPRTGTANTKPKGKFGKLKSVASSVMPIGLNAVGLNESYDNAVNINGNAVINVAGSLNGGGGASSAIEDIVNTGSTISDLKRGKGKGKPGEPHIPSGRVGGAVRGAEGAVRGAEGAVNMTRLSNRPLPKLRDGNSMARAVEGTSGAVNLVDTASHVASSPVSKLIKTKSGKAVSFLGGSAGGSNLAVRIASQSGMGFIGQTAAAFGGGKAADVIEPYIHKILGSDFIVKSFGKHANILPKVGKFVTEKLARVGVKKLPQLVAKLGTRATALIGGGVASLGVIPAAMLGYDAISGGMEARRIFGIGKDAKVTLGMRTASSLAKLIDNNLTFGFIDVSEIATFIYKLIASKDDEARVANDQNKFKQGYSQYAQQAEAKGEKVKDYDSYKKDNTFGVMSSIGNGFKSIGTGIKNTFTNANKTVSKVLGINKPEDVQTTKEGAKKLTFSNMFPEMGSTLASTMIPGAGAGILAYKTLNKSFKDTEKSSTAMIERAQKSSQNIMEKNNEALANSASQYTTYSKNIMQYTAGIAATTEAASRSAQESLQHSANMANQASGVKTTVPTSKPTTIFGKIGNAVSNTVKNVTKSISKFFGGNGPDDNSSGTQQAPQPSGGIQYHNGMAYYSQEDPRWASTTYAAKGEKSTIKQAACGPTSMAMVISSLTGQPVDPTVTAKWSMDHGYKLAGVGTSWDYFNAQAKQYGFGMSASSPSVDKAKAALMEKKPVIFSGKGGAPFTKGGHFIVGAGITPDGNSIIVNDPVNLSRSIAYPAQQIIGSARQMWVADRALPDGLPQNSAGGAPGATGAAPQEDNSLMGALTKIGSAVSIFGDAVYRGETFTEAMLNPQQATGGAPGGMMGGVTSTGIPIGTKQLAEGITSRQAIFDAAGKEFNVEPALLQAIAMQESGGNANLKGAAWGLMQIESGGTTQDFVKFGASRPNGPYSSADRLVPEKAIPFGAKRVSEDLNRYSYDHLKAIQAYNWSHYSLDKLLKVYPSGNEWLNHRTEVGKYNGTGASKYGDPQYIEHVLRYYHGTQIKPAGGAPQMASAQQPGGNGEFVPDFYDFGRGPESTLNPGGAQGANTRNMTQAQQSGVNSAVEYANGMAYFSQRDPRWASKPYSAKGENSTIEQAACGPTSMAMVISSLTGQYVSPEDTVNWSMSKGYKVAGSGTSWGYFNPQAQQYGFSMTAASPNVNVAKEALAQRKPMIFSGRGAAPFTRGGHFIVGAGVTPDGKILVNDPWDKKNNVAWSADRIAGGSRQMWIADRPLSGNNPAISGGPGGGMEGAQQQAPEDNSLMGAITKIGSAVSIFADAVYRGETFTEAMLQPQVSGTYGASGGADGYSNAGGDLIGLLLKSKYNLSTKYEVGEKALREGAGAGFISSGGGDAGGKSYGVPQFTSKAGASVKNFVGWLQGERPDYAQRLQKHPIGSNGFDTEWKAIAAEDPQGFMNLQTKKADIDYYNPSASTLSSMGVNPDNRSLSLKAEVYSTGVQFGGGGFKQVANKAFGGKIQGLDDKTIMAKLLDEKSRSVGSYKFNGCSGNVQNGVRKRFAEEKSLTAQMYDREKSIGGTAMLNKPTSSSTVGEGGNGGRTFYHNDNDAKKQRAINNSLKTSGSLIPKTFPKPSKSTDTSSDMTPKTKVADITIKAQQPRNVVNSGQLNSFIKNSYSEMSDNINDLLIANSMRDTDVSQELAGGNFEELLQIVKQIADNTARTADSTEEIAEKEFNNTTVVANSKEGDVNNTDVTNQTSVMSKYSNPFTALSDMDGTTGKIRNSYELAKSIARK